MVRTVTHTLALIVGAAFLGCSGAIEDLKGLSGDGSIDPSGDADANGDTVNPSMLTPEQIAAEEALKYLDFAGQPLAIDRVDAPANSDRLRLKAYSVLLGDIPRVLGSTPASLNRSANTFADATAPWYVEPSASAQTAYATLSIAFEGCLTYTASPSQYSSAPNTTTATAECTAFARKFWNRTPSADELNSCVTAAVNDTTAETNARRRWAYACASVLTSAGFLAY